MPPTPRRRLLAIAMAVAAIGLGGCDGTAPEPSGSSGPSGSSESSGAGRAAAPHWRAGAALPVDPAGAAGRVVVRDGAWCGTRWLVVGAIQDGDETRPAVWSSPDARSWTTVPVRARSYYGKRAVLGSVACVGDRPVAVGSRPGGAHGNPRVSTFRAQGGVWVDVPAPFEQYGGPRAVNVGPVGAGPEGWLIAGNRTSGPAVWLARTPRSFRLVEGAPGLANDGDEAALASHAVWAAGAWHVVGGESAGTGRAPRAWTSADGRAWQRDRVPSGSRLDDLRRVVAQGDALVAVGRSATGFAAWRHAGGAWTRTGAFGSRAGSGLPDVVDLEATGEGLSVVVSDGSRYRLWTSRDGAAWREEAFPVDVRPSGDTGAAIVSSPHAMLLLVDDGRSSTVWLSADPGASGAVSGP